MVFHRIAGIVAVGALAGALIAYAAWPREYQRAPIKGRVDDHYDWRIPGIERATICQPEWVRTQRPSERVTEAIKADRMRREHPSERYSAYELDHSIPLCLGGDPVSYDNLWLQPIREAKIKDRLETRLCRAVCAGEIGLTEAQRCISSNWVSCYKTMMGIEP